MFKRTEEQPQQRARRTAAPKRGIPRPAADPRQHSLLSAAGELLHAGLRRRYPTSRRCCGVSDHLRPVVRAALDHRLREAVRHNSSEPRPGNPDVLDPAAAAHRRAEREASEFGWGAGLTANPDPSAGPESGGPYCTKVPGVRVR